MPVLSFFTKDKKVNKYNNNTAALYLAGPILDPWDKKMNESTNRYSNILT